MGKQIKKLILTRGIPDFDGDIEYEVDDNTDAHIVGKGNIDFYTLQTGL